ncbi:MAG: UDP-N-acetylmuramoyl-tripeptide-D-alanyl-D-alanine ligase [Candidatus Pacebacteria bacterium GW2011_GWF1_36_5]|nr:MAG: UDP-N-acetylmuramoyl-tripeptide-D-alanyl-D-alanine ligase [Candidatus Pacebacteria bacterium GW2011_GWF1_36_5]
MKQKIALFVLYYLRFFAKLQLRKNKNCKIVGVTGSAGKTSTRNAIYSVLKNKYKVKVSFKANSESGISLNILGLEMNDYSSLDWLRVLLLAPIKVLSSFEKFDYYVVEMGVDSPNPPKNMEFLLSIIQPKMAVFLNAGINHSFAFDHLSTDDDSNIKEICQDIEAESYSFGSDNICDLQILNHQTKIEGKEISSSFAFQVQSHYGKLKGQSQKLEIQIKGFLLPKHYAYSFAVAILIGLKAGLNGKEIKKALENNFHLPLGRASIIEGKNGSVIVDGSYNASSMKDMIELMANLPQSNHRKIALLGDMRELGEETKQMHEEIATLATKTFDQIFLVGKEMQKYALPIIQKANINKVEFFENSTLAGEKIAQLLRANDLVFVKGSQNTIFLEEAMKLMMKDRKEAKKLLCRQSPWWLSVKRQAAAK